MSVPQKKRKIGLTIAIPILAVLTAVILTGFFLLGKDEVLAWFLLIPGLVGVSLLAFGLISLILRVRRKAFPIVCTAVGGAILAYLLLIAAYITIGAIAASPVIRYDYREHLDKTSSVEVVEVIKTAQYEDACEFRVIKEILPGQWEELLADIADLEYHRPFGDPDSWYDGEIMVLIRFSPSVNGETLVLIGEDCPCYGEREGSRIRINSAPDCCESDDWEAFSAKYGLNELP